MPIPPPASTTNPVSSPVVPSVSVGTMPTSLRVDVDAVVAGPGDPDLELARQVGVAVHRLDSSIGSRRARRLTLGPGRLGGDGLSPSTHSSQYDAVRGRNRATISATTGASTASRDRRAGSGQAITLRTTSPQAASVVSSEALMPRDEVVQLALVDEVVLHALPGRQAQRAVGELGERSRASHCSGLITPPGTDARTMHE